MIYNLSAHNVHYAKSPWSGPSQVPQGVVSRPSQLSGAPIDGIAYIMRLRITRFALTWALATAPLWVGGTVAARAAVTPVMVEQGGDDGLTNRLVDEIQNRIMTSRSLTMNVDGSNPFFISIPSNVGWNVVAGQTIVTTLIKFRRGERSFGQIQVTCRETQLAACARKIVTEAENKAMPSR